MVILGSLFLLVGTLISIVGAIWLLVVAFQESILWGIACLLVPLAALLFVIMHWENAKTPFLVELAAIPLVAVGLLLMPQNERRDMLNSAVPSAAHVIVHHDA